MKKTILNPILLLITGLAIGIGGVFMYTNPSQSAKNGGKTVTTNLKYTNPKNTHKSGKKIFINASQNNNGNTSQMAKEMFGNQSYEQINLADYNIPQVGQGDGDFPEIYNKLKGAKTIVIGTPVYWSNISGYLKTFIDHMNINDDIKNADLYVIVQGMDSNQDAAKQSAYSSLNRISYRFGLNFVGIASNDSEVKTLKKKMLGM
ncbi:flavodoxin family protein [Fructilactobacillus vespulae]|uniref:flavodoxin family protein n=1 Tax=Fructilactobacillus vespulae TaxID=1249630 RepID=UPI0039B534B6